MSRVDVDALDSGGNSNEKVMALRNLHQQKVRILMKTINGQKSEIEKLKRATKEAKMAKKVQSQARKLKEMEVTVDVCKEKLLNKNGGSFESLEQVNDFILKKTCGAPLRFRPKTREKLQNEIAELEKANKRLQIKLKSVAEQSTRAVQETSRSKTPQKQTQQQIQAGAEDAEGIKSLLEQVELLKVAVASRDLNLRTHMDEMERMHGDLREMRVYEEKCSRLQRKYNHQKAHLKDLEDVLDDVTREKEREAHEKEQLKTELAYQKNDNPGGDQELGYLKDLRKLEAQVIELEQELDEKQRRSAAMAERVNQLKMQLRKHEEQNSEGSSTTAMLKATNDSLRQQLQEAKAELADVRDQHRATEVELGKSQHLQQGSTGDQEEMSKLREELTAADIEIDQLEHENKMLHDEVRKLKDKGAASDGGGRPSTGSQERQESLKRIRDLEQKLLTEQETSKKLRLTLQGLKNQNESLLMWKNQEHKKLEDENTVLQRKLNAANLLRRKGRDS